MIECYYQKCPLHEINFTPYGRDSEPFCTQRECTAKREDLVRWERERRGKTNMVELTDEEVASMQKVLYRERRRMADLERMAKIRGAWTSEKDEAEYSAIADDVQVVRGLLDRRV